MDSSVDRSVTFTHTDSSFLTTQIHHLTSLVLFFTTFLNLQIQSALWKWWLNLVTFGWFIDRCSQLSPVLESNMSDTSTSDYQQHIQEKGLTLRQSTPQGQACSPSSRQHRSSHSHSHTAPLVLPGISPPQSNHRYSFKHFHSNSILSFGMDLTSPLPRKHMKQRQMSVHSFHCINSFVK